MATRQGHVDVRTNRCYSRTGMNRYCTDHDKKPSDIIFVIVGWGHDGCTRTEVCVCVCVCVLVCMLHVTW